MTLFHFQTRTIALHRLKMMKYSHRKFLYCSKFYTIVLYRLKMMKLFLILKLQVVTFRSLFCTLFFEVA